MISNVSWRLGLLWPVLGAALVGCVGSSRDNDTGAFSASGNSGTAGDDGTGDDGPAAGEPGAPCSSDADCLGGAACLAPLLFPSGDRICSPSCTEATKVQDCAPLAALDYYIEVGLPSPSGDGNNAWNSPALYRGYVCEEGFCQFVCPSLAAVGFDDNGEVAGCLCLPHFTWTEDESHCEWDDDVECALLEKEGSVPCDACNSDQYFPGCSSGRYTCLLYSDAFTGECVEWVEVSELEACIAGSFGYDCDPDCYANCASAQCTSDFCNVDSDACLNLCCTESESSAAGDAGCDPDGGADTTGSDDGPGDGTEGGGVDGPEDTPAACTDDYDNDGDGFIDCDRRLPDYDCCGVGDCGCGGACAGHGACAENTPAKCTDSIDNDGDGFIDCDPAFPDWDCCGVGTCPCSGECVGHGQCA